MSNQAREKSSGTVKWFDPDKGFGFITQTDGKDVFVHKSQLPSGYITLTPGTPVEFEVIWVAKGPKAEKVRLA